MSAEIHYSRIQISDRDMPIKRPEYPIGEMIVRNDQQAVPAPLPSIPIVDNESIAIPSALDRTPPGRQLQNTPSTTMDTPGARAPTESQLFWRKIFDSGDQPLYDKNKGPIKTEALNAALEEARRDFPTFLINFSKHVRAIDTDFRGGRDAGDAKERLQRVGTMLTIFTAFTAFDWATSTALEGPFNKLFPLPKNPDKTFLAQRGAFKKIIEVMNDKYATALGNMLVESLTGKRGFVHEVADKGADTLNVGLEDKLEDWVNGPTLESAQRIFFQIPIAGALLEQGLTRLSLFQEKTPIHTATGKMLYMALGVYLNISRNARELKNKKLQAKK